MKQSKISVDVTSSTADDKPEKIPSAGVRGLFTFAGGLDYLASTFAAFMMGGLGVAMVAFLFYIKPFFSNVSDAESAGGSVDYSVVDTMVKAFAIIATAQFLFAFPGLSVANMSAARQKREWQKAVVKSVLRQNVGWFDTSNPEEISTKFGANIALVHKGLEGPVYGIFLAIGASTTGIVGRSSTRRSRPSSSPSAPVGIAIGTLAAR